MKIDKQVIRKGMHMLQPATRWQDAMPCGNGRIGALVYGHIRNEIIVLNHDNLFVRNAKPRINNVNQHLLQFRQMLLEGKYKEGTDFFIEKLKENFLGQEKPDPYQPVFDIKIDLDTAFAFSFYDSSLDYETGEATVKWSNQGNEFYRKVFVSRADDAVIMYMGTFGDREMECKFTIIPHQADSITGMGSGKDIKSAELPFVYNVTAQENWITLRAMYKDGNEFGGLARVVAKGGTVEAIGRSVHVRGATGILMMVKLFINEDSNSALETLRADLENISCEYQTLLSRHTSLHKPLFNRLKLQLQDNEQCSLSNEELLLKGYGEDVPLETIQRMFDYGRYLLICSSRPGGMPANLQGIWNGDYDPAWSSDYHNDVNIQMNYWAALPGNLPETTMPYFDYYESMLEDYRINAEKVYGCRGVFAPIAQSTHGMVYGSTVWVAWTAGAGWLAQLFYDYWLFTGDRDFLKNRAVPFLKEVALFYEDFLVEGKDGRLMFIPSLSPENRPSIEENSFVTINATMDVAIAREVLTNLCDACKLLDIEKDRVNLWKTILERLPQYEVNDDGAIKEWIHPDLPDNYHHRHQAHIYALFPGFEVTEETNPELFDAMRVAVEKRLVVGLTSQTGWSFALMANIYARLGDGKRALECLELLSRSCVGPNLFTYSNDWRGQGLTMFWGHGSQPPFQIDANLGLTAAVLEMLVFSAPGMIKLLPALPDKWARGCIEGVLCRGGIEVSIDWDMTIKKLKVTFISRIEQKITVKFPYEPEKLSFDSEQIEVENSSFGSKYRKIRLPVGKKVDISI
jgi:alpha-L-fucosidase 2